jgi:hypothetical protein
MREYASFAVAPEGMTREEQDELDRQMGQFILDVLAANEARHQEDPLVQVLRQAHQAKAASLESGAEVEDNQQ